ncbi:MAG: type II secretion system protein GspE [Candidatus Harrisonbacteria bacterium CG10_big_fil_rev_8_21_14_0_10_44_23]|uniref:Type II secretion system protein GspE n=1 Tax=Candidatus Harrisonbacteria bacterium CG10_big_fil_rev_8_21_14_0_10_44_23 TaxID=1974585 RepID=A0A2H0UQJ9_9BACT|nr:MAG: type II secretion system protein GspE [Candidatus Harrisonbacteria bacterium CG10_big_fil_rev_8_21_14_0_10_44_23]
MSILKRAKKEKVEEKPKLTPVQPKTGVQKNKDLSIDFSEMDKEVKKPPAFRSIIRVVDMLIQQAYASRSSDIHMDPEEKVMRIRFRIDGVLHDVYEFPRELNSEIITRIKVLSGLRTDEHFATQDGRLRVKMPDESFVDVRISIAPTYFGENCVMRLLTDHSKDFSLESLGFSEINLKKIERAIKKPYGLILATGPTGSGKTTTLYMVLKKLNNPEVSIVTIEDPIEYSLPGVDQIQVNRKTGLLFSTGLRSILRQDPNIVMVGEIRDSETATIAVNAAMTGHLVLSTLHTNDAPTTLPRLLDLGVEPFLIASTLNIAIGQRLVRTICEDCKVKKVLSKDEMDALKDSVPPKLLGDNKVFYRGEGCPRCSDSGFKGRIGIHEIIEITEKIRTLMMQRANADQIRRVAIEEGMVTMLEDGFNKAVAGRTTIEEVLRVFHE